MENGLAKFEMDGDGGTTVDLTLTATTTTPVNQLAWTRLSVSRSGTVVSLQKDRIVEASGIFLGNVYPTLGTIRMGAGFDEGELAFNGWCDYMRITQTPEPEASTESTSYTYNTANQLLSASGAMSASYLYDSAGNMITSVENGQATQLTYDHHNRLTSLSRFDGDLGITDTHTYTGDGRMNVTGLYNATTGYATQHRYDAYGRMTTEGTPAASVGRIPE